MLEKHTTYQDPFASKWSEEKQTGPGKPNKKRPHHYTDPALDRIEQAPKLPRGLGKNGPVTRYNAAGEVIPNPPSEARQKGTQTELEVLNRMLQDKVAQRRTGFPDFAVLDGPDGVPIGFVEVKRNKLDKRRFDQVAFQRFCERFDVPYLLWWPGVQLPDWLTAVAGNTVGGPVLFGETLPVAPRHGGRIARKMRSIALHGPISALV